MEVQKEEKQAAEQQRSEWYTYMGNYLFGVQRLH